MGEIKKEAVIHPPTLPSPGRCSGCGRCVAACREKLYTLETVKHRKHAVNSAPEKCRSCGSCISSCPIDILSSQSVSP